MKKLIAAMQKKVSREEMVNKLEEVLLPLASILNDTVPVYQGFPIESAIIKGNENSFMVGYNGSVLALIDLKQSQFSVFHSTKYDLTAEECAVISHLWTKLQKLQSKNAMDDLMEMITTRFGNN